MTRSLLVVVAALAALLLARAAIDARPSGDVVERGRYVFGTVGGCACHTPPDAPGVNAGGWKFEGPFGVACSRNITPDRETGIGAWTDEQIATFLRTGVRPSGQAVHSLMALAIQGTAAGSKDMTPEDALAIARYPKTIPAVVNKVR